ncbi:MAG TPA: hypothetical protein VKA96_01325 [Solirubrobacteraceae bacterium]|nr:hypothetical protein [Solirubrobacteraceae bacterium]
MKRYLIDASIEPSSAVTAALAASSISVVDSPPTGDGEGPRRERPMTLAVNAPSAEEAIETVADALRRWGDVPVEVVDEEPL